MKPIKEWTPREIIDHMGLRSQPPVDMLEAVRREFADWSAKLEQKMAQSKPLSAIEYRRHEYYAAEAILKVLGLNEPDTSDIPEAGEEWFKKAELR